MKNINTLLNGETLTKAYHIDSTRLKVNFEIYKHLITESPMFKDEIYDIYSEVLYTIKYETDKQFNNSREYIYP